MSRTCEPHYIVRVTNAGAVRFFNPTATDPAKRWITNRTQAPVYTDPKLLDDHYYLAVSQLPKGPREKLMKLERRLFNALYRFARAEKEPQDEFVAN